MAAITKLGLDGYGVHRSGSFAGKTPDSGSGPHPVIHITRLSLDGYGVHIRGSFAGKTTAAVPTGQVQQAEQFSGGYFERPSRRRTPEQLRADRERYGILEAAAEVIDQVAFRQVEQPGLDALQQVEELQGELKARGLPLEGASLELLQRLRVDYEAKRQKEDAARAAEELDIVFVAVMLAELHDLDD